MFFSRIREFFRERKRMKVLRAIWLPKGYDPETFVKDFQSVNRVIFDPYDYEHVSTLQFASDSIRIRWAKHLFGKDKE